MEKCPVTVIIIGAGIRGNIYASYSQLCPDKMKVVGVVDTNAQKRDVIAKIYNIPSQFEFSSVDDLIKAGKLADAVVISTLDQTHSEITVKMANEKYNILLEKPMAVSVEDCKAIHEAAIKNNIILSVCHVMRYTPNYSEVMRIVESGMLGEIYSVQHLEAIGNTHFAHSFVRGNWRKQEETSFSLMTKSIHDIDLINWFMQGSKCTKVSSFGSLSHFKKDKKPIDAGDALRCVDCAFESECAYSAKKIYLDPARQGNTGWPLNAITQVVDIENIGNAITRGPYGRCVYECDNDVCDNQVVNFEFEGGKTASFTMIAFTEDLCVRKTKIYGSKGELHSDGDHQVKFFDFKTRETTIIYPHELEQYNMYSGMNNHGGGDYGVISSFIDSLILQTPKLNKSDSLESLTSHILTFAAEKSRLTGSIVCPRDI
ncbi:hypothetical protein BB561_002203 [Smittium simulii]|uniref:Gfo/Idh/MocA-like oxidoreductase N-terminal domain-containing protein n=1 Tax=Smittium simulii TaxID=133385 RepID=A0A2T9YRD3_9FUNG|nr:hypothetical protein BB561_002203 [Smittium simulii]